MPNRPRPIRRLNTRRVDKGWLDPMVIIGSLIILLIPSAIIFGIVNATHVEEHNGCTVTDKDRTSGQDGKSDMRVYTSNCGNFHVADSLLSWTWSSSDTYGSIEVGKTYDFKTRGFRVPLLSMFPNVVEAQEVQN